MNLPSEVQTVSLHPIDVKIENADRHGLRIRKNKICLELPSVVRPYYGAMCQCFNLFKSTSIKNRF